MAIATYAQLKTAVSLWLDDNQYTANAEDFITLGEKRITRDLRVGQMEARATAATSTTTRFMSFPAGFVEMRHLQLNTSPVTILQFVPPQGLDRYRESSAGKPSHYSMTANQIELNRITDSAYTAEIGYYKLTPLVTTTQETNEVFPEFAELYMFAAMAEGLAMMHEPAGDFQQKYSDALDRIVSADLRRKYPQGPLKAAVHGTVW